ncbi:hypothetical protein LEP1GSC062_2036 [Leptospira alexanderi serovar Manhao 3 str. L 60]|uniref:Uncharacterized protein n=1 Tax=Leptospira alexanderi serovar Manhao 3 str. L 60 TaxID=1049759 RepID=V6I3K6_9LEPT|nr:hypothetical protein LEP1GSC062_2036 [Leptospira alexanderi serovar Manhao 3 str. L 60]
MSYNRNNIGRDNQSSGVSANIRGQYGQGSSGSLGLSYDTKAGYGATVGLTSGLGPLLSVTPSWTVSEYGGLSSDVQYGFNKNLFGNLFNKVNNPEHSAANRNLLDDIWNGMGSLVSGIGAVGKSAWDGLSSAVGGINGENLSNGWAAIKKALFGGGNDGGDGLEYEGLKAALESAQKEFDRESTVADNAETSNVNPNRFNAAWAKLQQAQEALMNYLSKTFGGQKDISNLSADEKAIEAQRAKVPILEGEEDVTDGYIDQLREIEQKLGVSGGKLILSAKGNMQYRRYGDGAKSTPIIETEVINSIDWGRDSYMHTDDQKGEGDFYLKNGSKLSIFNTDDGKFKITKIHQSQLGGTTVTVEFMMGQEKRIVAFRHLDNQIPEEILNNYKNKVNVSYDVGTVFGYGGMTGNMAVPYNKSTGKITGLPAFHSHLKIYGYEGTTIPDWAKRALKYEY